MGLAGAKNKKKWAKDPNNNAWSRNTNTFAQKIMRSQGWAPGDYLGAKDASHSEYFGAANASHIKTVLKDDNMGLGAKRNGGDECVGLFDFQALLGRLNGKSEESLDEERQKRDTAKMNMYLHRKLGTVRFVFAGYLVGDKVQDLADEMQRQKDDAAGAEGTTDSKKEKSKKRKAEADDDAASEQKQSKKSEVEVAGAETKAERRARREQKRRDKEASRHDSAESNAEPEDKKTDDAEGAALSRKKAKTDKKEKKEKRRKSKTEDTTPADTSDATSKKEKKRSEKGAEAESGKSSELSTPTTSGTATPTPHRHLARQRFIAQKRAAVMDQAALNQIFMIKT